MTKTIKKSLISIVSMVCIIVILGISSMKVEAACNYTPGSATIAYSSGTISGSWRKPTNGRWRYSIRRHMWWWQFEDGTWPYDETLEINGKLYYFDEEGWCYTNGYHCGNYFAPSGEMVFGETTSYGYLYKSKKGTWFGHTYNNRNYPEQSKWCKLNGWVKVENDMYYVKDGYVVTSTTTINGVKYRFAKNGKCLSK